MQEKVHTGKKVNQPENEQKLVEKIRSGDISAYKVLYVKHYPGLVKFAWNFVRDSTIAENIIQDLFVKIWLKREKLDPSSNIKSYLFKAAKNQSLMYLRHLKVKQGSEEKIRRNYEPIKTPEDTLLEKDLGAAVLSAIEDLPEKCRRVFIMNRLDEFKYSEIAEILEISIKTVEAHMGRAYKFLRKRLACFQ